MGYAVLHIIGNLGSDPELRNTADGQQVTSFNIAVSQSTKNKQTGEWDEETDWFRCTLWGTRGTKFVERFRKGNKVAIDGPFKTREFTGRDGEKRLSLEIRVDNYQDLTPRQRGEASAYDSYGGPDPVSDPPRPAAPSSGTDLDDLPF